MIHRFENKETANDMPDGWDVKGGIKLSVFKGDYLY